MKEMYLPTVQVEKAVHQLYRTLQSFVKLKVLLTLAFSAGVWEAELQKKKKMGRNHSHGLVIQTLWYSGSCLKQFSTLM